MSEEAGRKVIEAMSGYTDEQLESWVHHYRDTQDKAIKAENMSEALATFAYEMICRLTLLVRKWRREYPPPPPQGR